MTETVEVLKECHERIMSIKGKSKEDKKKLLILSGKLHRAIRQHENTHIIEVLEEDFINEMGYYPKSGNIKALAYDMSEAYCEQDKVIEFNALVDKHGFEEHHQCRICSKTIVDGFHTLDEDGDNTYYCSDECLHKVYTEEQWKHLHEEEPEEFYYSEWR